MRKILIISIALLILSCNSTIDKSTYTFTAMGGIPINLTVYDNQKTHVFSVIEDTVEYLDSILSKYDKNSAVYKFNNYNTEIKFNEYLFELVEYSFEVHEKSGGLFDIRIETVLSYYERCEKGLSVFLNDSIEYFRNIIENEDIYIEENTLKKTNEIIKIDFGGIAKGYMADIAKRIMIREGITKGIIDIGGDLTVFNHSFDESFVVGIRDKKGEGIYKTIKISNGSAATSGDYYRYYVINGKKICHIINPKTCLQHDEIHSITVIAEKGVFADGYATAMMIMPYDSIFIFAEKHNLNIHIQK